MPLLTLTTNQLLSPAQKSALPAALSAETARLLGKPESYVMVIVQDKQMMTMGGAADAAAYLQLKSLGLPEGDTEALSAALCDLVSSTLDIPADRIYIEFSSPARHLWGWNRSTFA
ncbi:phenylpyruvate tautomerase MIF-related protein [Thiolapillus sp.]